MAASAAEFFALCQIHSHTARSNVHTLWAVVKQIPRLTDMENPENEDLVNHTPEPAADIEMPTVASADEQPDPSPQSNHTAKHTDGHTDPPKKPLQDSLVSAPGSWQIPPGALAANQSTNATAPAASKSAEKIEKVEQRIRDDPYDLDAWTILINEIQNSGDIAAIRDVYERVLKVFPTSVGFSFGVCEGRVSKTCLRYMVPSHGNGDRHVLCLCEKVTV